MSEFLVKSQVTEKGVQVLEQLIELFEAEGSKPIDTLYREVIYLSIKEAYKTANEVIEAPNRRGCLCELAGRTCTEKPLSLRCAGSFLETLTPSATTFWLKEGKLWSVVCQPFLLDLEDLRDLLQFCDEYHLNLRMTGTSWFCPNSTVLIELRRQEENGEAQEATAS